MKNIILLTLLFLIFTTAASAQVIITDFFKDGNSLLVNVDSNVIENNQSKKTIREIITYCEHKFIDFGKYSKLAVVFGDIYGKEGIRYGTTKYLNNTFYIVLDINKINELRFDQIEIIFAHEMAHYVRHHYKNLYCTPSQKVKNEKHADFIAGTIIADLPTTKIVGKRWNRKYFKSTANGLYKGNTEYSYNRVEMLLNGYDAEKNKNLKH